MGKTCIFDHEQKSVNQTARIYRTALRREPGRKTRAGEEYVQLTARAYLPKTQGNGEVIELTPDSMKVTGTVTAGAVFVDGLGVGDVGSIVLRDRQRLAEDGLIVVVATINSKTGQLAAGPDIVSRGFVYVRESEELMERARKVVRQALLDCLSGKTRDWSSMKLSVRDTLSGFLYRQTQRSPMILPVLMEI